MSLDSRAAQTGSTPVSSVPLMDVQRQYQGLKAEIEAAVQRVCASGQYVLGPDVQKLEQQLAAYCGVPHAVACASGSDALLLALMALDVGPGDEVICPSFTFFATASAAWRLGAKPVFVDLEPLHYNLDPQQLAARITSRTKAIIPVHLYGQAADMDPILAIARRHNIAVVEDAAQAIGAAYQGRSVGSLGDIGCLSFYPTKNLGCFGDGGMLLTTRADLADRLRLLRGHGMQPRYHHQVVGINSRLDSVQAAILLVKLAHLDHWTALRQHNADRYTALFTACGLNHYLQVPRAAEGRRHVWNQYVVRVPQGNRDPLREHLRQNQIGTEIYYPIPLHLQKCFASLGQGPGSFPQSEQAADETLALPIFPELTAQEQVTVVQQIAQFLGCRWPDDHALTGPNFLKRAAETTTQHGTGPTRQ